MKNKFKFLPLASAILAPVGVISVTSCNSKKQATVTLPEYTEIYLNNSEYELSPTFENFGEDKTYTLEVEDDEIFGLNAQKNKLTAEEKQVAGFWIQPKAGVAKTVTLTTNSGHLQAQTKAIIKGSNIAESAGSFGVGKVNSVTVYPETKKFIFKTILNGKYTPLYADNDRWFDFVEYITGTRIAVINGLTCKVYYDGKDITDQSEFSNGTIKIKNVSEGAPKFESGKELRFEFDSTNWTLTKTTYNADIGIRFYSAE